MARFRRLIAAIWPTTLAGKLATTFAFFEGLFIVMAGSYFLVYPPHGGFPAKYYLSALLFAVVATVCLYIFVSYWDRIEGTPFPDIQEAWREGWRALDEAGLLITTKTPPMFLVLGLPDDSVEDAIMQTLGAGGMDVQVNGIPRTPGVQTPLRWYAGEEAIYLFCSGVGSLSALNRLWASADEESPEAFMGDLRPPQYVARPPQDVGMKGPVPPPALPRPAPVDVPDRREQAGGRKKSPPYFTVDWDRLPVAEQQELSPAGQARPNPASTSQLPVNIGNEPKARLRYLCSLIQRDRHPVCGINGLVTLLPFELVEAGETQLRALTDAIRGDTDVIYEKLGLRFPVTAAVVGMQRARGFCDLIELLPGRFTDSRLGAGFHVWRCATKQRLCELSDGICDAFEGVLHHLFRRDTSLQQIPKNRNLYALLCRIRRQLKPKLSLALTGAFSLDDTAGTAATPDSSQAQTRAYFGGCYLVASGPTPEQNAFIRGIHHKLIEDQVYVEWTEKTNWRERNSRFLVVAGWVAFAVILVFVLVVTWLRQ